MVPPSSQLSPSPYERTEEESFSFDAFVLLSTTDSTGGSFNWLPAAGWKGT